MLNMGKVAGILASLEGTFDEVDESNPMDAVMLGMTLDAIRGLIRKKALPKMEGTMRSMLKEHPELAEQLPPGEAERILKGELVKSKIVEAQQRSVNPDKAEGIDFNELFFGKGKGPVS